ncbi:MAG: GntR family transcriptional regulator [Anaerovoracaceae bacterium]
MFQLDLRSRKSIYEQVVDNVKELIMTSVLVTGEKLPSVRELSKMITVNPNTVMKAYQELEREGYIYTTSGVGTFVADKSELCVDSKRLEEVKNSLLNAFKQLQYLGLSFDDAKDVALKIINERGNKND